MGYIFFGTTFSWRDLPTKSPFLLKDPRSWLTESLGTFLVVQCLGLCPPMQGTWFPSLVWELRSHILSASTSVLLDCHPESSSSGWKWGGWLMGPPNRCHPLGAGVLDHRHQQTSLTLWGPCSEVSVSRTPRCTSSSWNNLWLGPISPLSRTSFTTRFCISFWGVC